MARKPSSTLTDAELRVMQVLWDKGRATVGDVAAALAPHAALAYTTVLTMLRILESKGYARRAKEGRAHVYEASVNREQARTSAVRHLLSRLFDGSPELLMLKVMEDERVDLKELRKLKQMIQEKENP